MDVRTILSRGSQFIVSFVSSGQPSALDWPEPFGVIEAMAYGTQVIARERRCGKGLRERAWAATLTARDRRNARITDDPAAWPLARSCFPEGL
jgi:hypothetical protein